MQTLTWIRPTVPILPGLLERRLLHDGRRCPGGSRGTVPRASNDTTKRIARSASSRPRRRGGVPTTPPRTSYHYPATRTVHRAQRCGSQGGIQHSGPSGHSKGGVVCPRLRLPRACLRGVLVARLRLPLGSPSPMTTTPPTACGGIPILDRRRPGESSAGRLPASGEEVSPVARANPRILGCARGISAAVVPRQPVHGGSFQRQCSRKLGRRSLGTEDSLHLALAEPCASGNLPDGESLSPQLEHVAYLLR